MNATVDMVKALRQSTGAGVMDCKRALEEAKGNIQKAEDLLKDRGMVVAAKKASRETREGVIEAYIHSGNRLGALVEINCETDFVARTQELKAMAHDLAMQVAAMSPSYLTRQDMKDDDGRPPEEVCLMLQPFIKDPSRTVEEVVQETIALVGENIRVGRFLRFALGE